MNHASKLDEWDRRGREIVATMWSKLTRGWSDLEDDSE